MLCILADLFEGIPQLLHADHICSLSQHLGTHQLDKVLKVHPAPTLRRRRKTFRRLDTLTGRSKPPSYRLSW